MTEKRYLADELIAERWQEEIRENIRDGFHLVVDKPGYRQVAARAFISLAGIWGLSRSEAAALLLISTAEYREWEAGSVDGLDADSLAKISCLLGNYKYLCTLYSGHIDRVGGWFRRELPIEPFSGKTPIDVLSGADVGSFLLIRRHLAGWTV